MLSALDRYCERFPLYVKVDLVFIFLDMVSVIHLGPGYEPIIKWLILLTCHLLAPSGIIRNRCVTYGAQEALPVFFYIWHMI